VTTATTHCKTNSLKGNVVSIGGWPTLACESNYVYLQSWENYKGQYFHN
jgi:hypothetical protein